MDTPARLLRLLAMFTTRPSWNADDLAQRLEITTRTLRRDVTRLRDLGYPITSTTGRCRQNHTKRFMVRSPGP